MNWTAVWRPSATGQLAQLWTSAPDRNAVAAAANQIDDELEHDPLSAGEARAGPTRILIVHPPAVYFDVDVIQREAAVWAVWRVV